MIRLVDDSNVGLLRELSLRKNIFACRIACLLDSYGIGYDFCRFWLQLDENEKAISAVSRYYSDVTAELTPDSDTDELRDFLEMIGYGSLFADKPFTPPKGRVMRLAGLKKPAKSCSGRLELSPGLNEVYRLLSSCEGELEIPGYESFMLDMSHKLRHGTALCAAVKEGDRLVSCAMTVAQSETCAVIGAVATSRELRGRGYGSECVCGLCARLSDKEVFLITDSEENRSFYRSLGFIEE